jgi:hypothetical protein
MPASASERWHLAALALGFGLVARSAVAAEPGDGQHARSELLNVPLAAPGKPGSFGTAVDLGLGITEPLRDDDATHQRLGLGAAASVDAAHWLNLGLLVSARYDRHGSDEQGGDDGLLFQSGLSARAAWQTAALGFGVEVGAWLPGGPDVSTSLSAISGDGRLFVSQQTGRLMWGAFGGYRLDRSAEAAEGAEQFRFGDRSALGASDFDAALLGVGLGYAAGRSLLFGEVTSRLLLGAPSLGASPSFLALGVRHPLGESGLAFEVSLSGLVSSRPSTEPEAELSPIEPRALLSIGLRYRPKERAPAAPTTLPAAPVAPPAPAPPLPPPPSSVELALLDDQGQPLPHAQVTLLQGEKETRLVERAPGRYGGAELQAGTARLRVQAEGFEPVEREVTLAAGRAVQVDVQVQQALPAGQVRGLVRSQRGKPLAAKVRVEPAGVQATTDAEGFFQLDVPPGQYEVVIESPGFQSQKRTVKVEKQGVVIVNADLGQAP